MRRGGSASLRLVGNLLRFDDTLETVLSADLGSPQAVQSSWRQLVDLIGRRRVPADYRAMSTLRTIRDHVPEPVRAASARALEYANPPAALVRLFANEEIRVALPVLRSARMSSSDWVDLLPELSPAARSVLRNRRDLGPVVKRALEAFGPIDFVLGDERPIEALAQEQGDQVTDSALLLPDAFDTVERLEDSPSNIVSAEAIEPANDAIFLGDSSAFPINAPNIPNFVAPNFVAPFIPSFPSASDPLTDGNGNAHLDAAAEEQPAADPLVSRDAANAPIAAESGTPAMTETTLIDDMVIPLETISASDGPQHDPVPQPALSVEDETDFSFIEFAEGGAAAPSAPLFRADPTELLSQPDQSETGGAVDENAAIELAAASEQVSDMDIAAPIVSEPTLDALDLLYGDRRPAAKGKLEGAFAIVDVVERINAFWQERQKNPKPIEPIVADSFRFESDSKGVLRWVDGVSRAALVGLSLDAQPQLGAGEGTRVDAAAAGAYRRRAGFSNARLIVEGDSDAAGDWLISGIPVFDPSNGRFTGYRGTARRPRVDERAEPIRVPNAPTSADSLRQLVHELRTPANAISGFAEMIESEMLGPVSDHYRDRAGLIRAQARDLMGAIDDLDLAARLESETLSLNPGHVALRPILSTIAEDLVPLSALRGSALALPVDDLAVLGDLRAVERLLARLLATLVSASGEGERIGVDLRRTGEFVQMRIDRPQALSDYPGETVLGIDDEQDDTLLGTGFALRLARNLARELGGSLLIGPDSLDLRLPASEKQAMDQVHSN